MDGFEIPLDQLESQITELAGQLNAANFRWLSLIAEFDRREGWVGGGLLSCAHWLNFKCGLALGAAREKVRVAHSLLALPKIAESMAHGALSYSKVRALTRVATPATEDALLMIALHGTASHVENIVRSFRRAQQAEALSLEAHQHATRGVEYWYDTDGSLVLKARLPALAAMAETYLRSTARSASAADRYQVVVHVDANTLKDDSPGRCHVEHGPPLAAETVRRLACDASVVTITESADGEVIDIGRKTRSIPPSLRRALKARDQGCCFPGCTHRSFVDAHHIEHWAKGGATQLDNLVTLCRRHHRFVHEGGITVEACADRTWRFRRPGGQTFAANPPPHLHDYEWTELGAVHAALGLNIDADTAACRWTGERMDYELGVWVLCHQEERAQRNVPAGILEGQL